MIRYSSWWLIVLIGLQLSSLAQPGQISIARIEAMPSLPSASGYPRLEKIVAIEYNNLIFSTNHQGQYLPLLSLHLLVLFNYSKMKPYFLTHTWKQRSPQTGRSQKHNARIIGATLVGIDKSNQNGINYVAKLKDFFNLKNGQLLYLNNYFGITGNDWWYEVMPNLFSFNKKAVPQLLSRS
jgi:hypothetical protein